MAIIFDRPQRLTFLRAYGSQAMSYSTLQPGMSYFDMAGVGYIAYFTFQHPILAPRSRRIALADPICPAESRALILRQFLDSRQPTLFVQISEPVAALLAEYGLRTNQLGVETSVRLEDFTLAGREKSKIRHWRNKALKEGVSVFERPINEVPETVVKSISRDWLARKGGRELRFLTRPLSMQAEEMVRYFWAQRNGQFVGMSIFDPVCRGGGTVTTATLCALQLKHPTEQLTL